jgi:hypothetical protein
VGISGNVSVVLEIRMLIFPGNSENVLWLFMQYNSKKQEKGFETRLSHSHPKKYM